MKKCPQCRAEYSDENLYCFNDGNSLVDEPPPTVAFNQPTVPAFVVDLSAKNETPTVFAPLPPRGQIVSDKPTPKNYIVPLLLGLLIGGGLVLATVFLMNGFGESKREVAAANSTVNKANENINTKSNENVNSNSAKPEGNTNSPKENLNAANSSASTNTAKTNQSNNSKSDLANVKIEEVKPKKKGNYNGRVIMLNANLRSAPTDYADTVDVLPLDEPVRIGKRAAPDSPWFLVKTADGKSGWMHGKTIEFTR